MTLSEQIESLIRDLPDEKGARLFLERLSNEQPRTFQTLLRDPALLSDALALAAWSPLLATTLEQNPDYISWLRRERADVRVRTRDQLKESLARFALTNSTLTPQILFARFRRRELLRIYLHDVRRAHTLVETTEELSNLADAILDYALSLARQISIIVMARRSMKKAGEPPRPSFALLRLASLAHGNSTTLRTSICCSFILTREQPPVAVIGIN